MEISPLLKWLVAAIIGAALVAAGGGLWPAAGTPYSIVNFRGEAVTINARGLYYWDTVSMAAQMQANDLVTLCVAVPLLAVALGLARRGSLRGHLLMTGTLGYFLYTYITMSFGAAYNAFFLIYVALFGLSFAALVLALLAFDLPTLPDCFSAALPRRIIAALLFVVGAFLLLAWLGRIAQPWLTGEPPALENVTTMFIQALDLAVVVPLCLVGGVLLLRRSAWGYLLTSVALVKFTTLGLAVTLMGLNMARVGVAINIAEVAVFSTITLINVALTALLLYHLQPPMPAPAGAET